jgi:HK97 family phage portal protein
VGGWRQLLFDGPKTITGRRVSADTAMMHATVYTCVRFLAFNVAQLPLILYRRKSNDPKEPARERATDHPLFERLHTLANDHVTAFNSMALLIGSLMLRGNGLAFVLRDKGGAVMGLFPLRWDQIEIMRDRNTGELVYEWKPQEQPPQTFRSSEVWHIQGLGVDGVQGLSPIALMRESVGHGLALQEFGSRFFSNSATPSGALEMPGELSDGAYKRLKEGMEQNRAGLDNAHKVLLLEEGAKWQQIGISPEDAQFLESRKFNRAEIAGWYGIPPHLIGDLEKATFSNIEQQSLEFVIYFLMPWLVNIEQTITRDLLSADERGSLFAKFNIAGLLRGDSAARSNAQRTGVIGGWLTRNEVRAQEELNPLPGLDDPIVPLNVTTIQDGEIVQPESGAIPGAPPGPQR